ncbi:hypothetical protein [Planctomonas psychrotolerans]|uniref:hypothetical protein n=1 Tax=Planctomonas psychrotolerans TaxID=2528712 RepID=UPI00123963AA|nr:hypothetical protein [Planctomonas psychrotolerans]
MPSYRITMTIGALRPGIDPAAVLPAASAAAAELATVEASAVDVVAGAARVTVRFTEDDAEVAAQVGGHVAATVARLADVPHWALTERVGGRWRVVA